MIDEKKILLVSASPRRAELLRKMDITFTVNTKTLFREVVPEGMVPEDVPAFFAEGKAKGFHRELSSNEVIIASDTVVICDGKLMGKPFHRDKAMEMLRFLSGKTHKVVSAVCVRDKKHCKTLSDTALVTFRRISEEEIEYYVNKYLPVDKAGGYGIQEWIGLQAITRIEGSYFTIMGLPTHLVSQLLSEID